MSSKLLREPGPSMQPLVLRRIALPAKDPGGNAALSDARNDEQISRRIRDLEMDAARREQQAHEAGFQKGEAAGFQKGEAVGREAASCALKPVLENLSEAVADLCRMRPALRREAEDDVVKLAVAISRRILHREVSSDPDALLGVVKAAMHKLDSREIVRLRVHPDHVQLLQSHFQQLGLPCRLEIAGDPGLERGGVFFETARGTMDASLETQLQEIQRGLIDRLDRRSA